MHGYFRGKINLDIDPLVILAYSELRRMKAALDERRIPALIAVLPSVNTFWSKRTEMAWVAHLHDFADRNGFRFVDLEDGLWDFEAADQFFDYAWDNHLLGSGHEVVGAQLVTPVSHLIRISTGMAEEARNPRP